MSDLDDIVKEFLVESHEGQRVVLAKTGCSYRLGSQEER